MSIVLLLVDVTCVGVRAADQLRDVAVAIFGRAVAEPAFSPTYAEFFGRLVPKMRTFEVTTEDGKKEQQTFKRHILNQCQKEFEGEGHELTDEQRAALTDEQKEALSTKQKKRLLGMCSLPWCSALFAVCCILLLSAVSVTHPLWCRYHPFHWRAVRSRFACRSHCH
jgi:hypothetical protein